MKIVVPFLITLMVNSIGFAQKKDFKEKTLNEISSLIENAHEFLGKSVVAVLGVGKPSSIQGGDQWEVFSVDSSKKTSDLGTMIMIATGCGVLTLFISPKTKLVDVMEYLPHKKAKLTEEDLRNRFKDKYIFDQKGIAFIQTTDSERMQVSIAGGIIFIGTPER